MKEEVLFQLGIKRDPGRLFRQPRGTILNLGSGFLTPADVREARQKQIEDMFKQK